MKLLQFNILDGCKNDGARLKRIGDFVIDNSYDIVGLNEAPLEMDQIGKDWGYQYSQIAVSKGRGYCVAILSRYPIRLHDMYSTLFHHSMLHVEILSSHFIVTHLDPKDSILREKETLLMGDIIKGIIAPLMVMGDFNSLSPLDKERHEEVNIKAVLQSQDRLLRKFLNPDGSINYKPIEHLLESGLQDLFYSLNASAPTVPTQYNKDAAHAIGMRLDYVMINKFFIADFAAKVVSNNITDTLSDHYPLECVWKTR